MISAIYVLQTHFQFNSHLSVYFTDLVNDSLNDSTIQEVNDSNNAETDAGDTTLNSSVNSTPTEAEAAPKRRNRGWPKGVPRGVKKWKRTVLPKKVLPKPKQVLITFSHKMKGHCNRKYVCYTTWHTCLP